MCVLRGWAHGGGGCVLFGGGRAGGSPFLSDRGPISRQTVRNILRGETWIDLPTLYRIEQNLKVLRKIRAAETAHTVIATVDGELNEWTDTDLTAGDRRYKVVAVRDSLTSRRSRVAKLMLDEPPPPPLRPTPGTITYVPEKEPLTERAQGDTCTPAANIVDIAPGTATSLSNGQNWVKVTLTANVKYQIYYDDGGGNSTGTVRIDFVCGPDDLEIENTRANAGTGLGSQDASLDFTPSATGFHYVKTTMSTTFSKHGKPVLVADLSNDETDLTVAVGGAVTGTFGTPTDHDVVNVPMVNGTTYQIDVRSVGYPGIDPWIIDIYDQTDRITRPAGMFGASYDGFFDHDSGPGNAARVIYTATKTEDHYIVFGSRGSASQQLGDWHLQVTEASAPFYDDYAADGSTSGTVVVGGSVSGRIDSTPSWYNAGDTGGPSDLSGYLSREPGYMGDHWGYSCHREIGDGAHSDQFHLRFEPGVLRAPMTSRGYFSRGTGCIEAYDRFQSTSWLPGQMTTRERSPSRNRSATSARNSSARSYWARMT